MAAALGFGDDVPLCVQFDEHATWKWVISNLFDEILEHPNVTNDRRLDALLIENNVVIPRPR